MNTALSESNQYHKIRMLVGSMTNFDGKLDAEVWIKKENVRFENKVARKN